jgi:hypothetical protein
MLDLSAVLLSISIARILVEQKQEHPMELHELFSHPIFIASIGLAWAFRSYLDYRVRMNRNQVLYAALIHLIHNVPVYSRLFRQKSLPSEWTPGGHIEPEREVQELTSS